ncbi:MAG: NAD(P)/FAD-dependent oxidoreductase [Pseudomonadota bacterium]
MNAPEFRVLPDIQSIVDPRRIAVVGAGIAGLTSAWLLSARDRVTLYEAGACAGGHTNTVDVALDGVTAPVDTGFLVFNDRTYPNLIAIFEALGVRWAESDMSFSVRADDENLEWCGSSLATVFAQRSNLARPAFWAMLRDILQFNREATALVAGGAPADGTVAGYLERHGYGRAFRDWYLVPMAAAIWSMPASRILDFPLATFLRFCHNHGLLQVTDRPRWRTVLGGGRDYVRRMLPAIHDLRLATPVARVARDGEGATVTDAFGRAERFDEVILACHSDQSLALLADATEAESALLGAVRYQPNRAILHTDADFLPRRPAAWAAWNYTAGRDTGGERGVCVSYLINRLQPLPFRQPVIVTLNPLREPAPERVIAEFDYAHPLFDQAAIDAQTRAAQVQGLNHTWFAGAWLGYGFHEDGVKSALAVVERLGAEVPWTAARELSA